MRENVKKILKKLGLQNLTLTDNVVRVLHLIPALIEDGHIISYGEPGTGKTTLIEKSTNYCTNISSLSNAILFGNQKTNDKGIISDKYDVVFYEQASNLSNIDDEVMTNLLTHCNGDNVKRIDIIYPNRTSIVFLGNCEQCYIASLDNLYPNFNISFFNNFPDEFKKTQGLERLIILPTFLMEKVTSKHIIENSKNYFEIKRQSFTKFDFEKEIPMRQYKEKCKIITTLNYFFNDNEKLDKNDWKFKGFEAIADSISNLKNGKYIPFYYKNENGRKLALALILYYFPEDVVIEEAHFLEHRALIKLKGENYWYKVALDKTGKLENIFEKEYQIKNDNIQFIAKIFEILYDGIILKQEFIPLATKYFSIKDFTYLSNEKDIATSKIALLEIEISKLKQKNVTQEQNIIKLSDSLNDIILYLKGIKDNINLELLENNNSLFEIEQSKKDFCRIHTHIKFTDLKNKNIGIISNQIKLINFAPILYTK